MSMNHAVSQFLSEDFSKQMRFTKADFVGIALSEASTQDLMELATKTIETAEETNLAKFEKLKIQIGVCTLTIVEAFAAKNYPEQWMKTEQQDFDSPVRLVADNPNQEHLDDCKRESAKDFARAHNEVLGARI
jgi:uncharacterized protein YaaN involved in tellurite resistance